ncbi:hypothetical protein [Cellulomonas biazotea]|uniref:Uncharacterized protein n=1 Tax=Cellulomonas biazotea TaxID=1709 RepID=A0A402DSH5_9CELL|nr:hypothetical protein [Cellulomonas biazotea]GCE77067.1 hypothetical protein CBZ_21230 [Cellulomonas biazotea]
MENDFGDDDTASRPSPAEARQALSELAADRATLAARVITPWWYHPALGGIVALIVGTQALPFPASALTLPVALFALPTLVVVYRRRYGVWISQPTGPRSRRVFRALMVVLLLAFAAALAVRFTGVAYHWALLPAVAGFVAAVVLGPWYDDLVRRELGATQQEAR